MDQHRFNQSLGLTEYCSRDWFAKGSDRLLMTALASLHPVSFIRRPAITLLPVLSALAPAGCAQQPKSATDPTTTGAISRPITQGDFQQSAQYWAQQHAQNPKDTGILLNYASSLQRLGRADEAVGLLAKAAILAPNNREVLAAYGKALAGKGDLSAALQMIRKAQVSGAPDWKLMSAEAAILDQMGQSEAARALYANALALQPNEPSILSNYGMSYVLTGDLKQAEKLLRQAIAQPGADSRVRQNLALVVGLQGRFGEAEKIASSELSPEQAKANMAYLQQMLGQQNSWQQLQGRNG